MFPVHKGMNSHPYQRNQVPCALYYHHPSCWEAIPSQKKEDPPSSSCYESWPHNYGYTAPMQCNNYCTHGQYPAYYNFRPYCSHFPSPPPAYFCGGYPPNPQSHPIYHPPPPHYSMEQPRYEYDKAVPGDQFHCCGCVDHPSHVKGGNSFKIEEQEPDDETTRKSLIPGRENHFPYPILWIPPDYATNKEQPRRLVENEANEQKVLPYVKTPEVQGNSFKTEVHDAESGSLGSKPHQGAQSLDQGPHLRNGLFPLDMSSIKQLMQGGDAIQNSNQENKSGHEKKAQDLENKDQNKQFSWPRIWIPYHGGMGNQRKSLEDESSGDTSEDPVYNVKVAPRKSENSDNGAEKGKSTAGDVASKLDNKSKVKIIPVKQLEDFVPKDLMEEDEHKVDRAPLSKESQDSVKTVTGRQSSSPTKKSKLSPICLRVDPPKKKNGNGSSRSPSPPNENRQDSDRATYSGKSKQPNKEIKVNDTEEKTLGQDKIEVSQGAAEAIKGSENLEDKEAGCKEKIAQQNDIDRAGSCNGEDGVLGEKAFGESQQESKQERRTMSEMEAAIILQSACRGYSVRRWEPLKKLKQIEEVREEVSNVKKHIEELESRAALDDKEKTATGETIMKLLLKLDTIQGLHQIIRDARRSVAKELIMLQEKLDSIESQKSVLVVQDTSAAQATTKSSENPGLVEKSEGLVEYSSEPSECSSLNKDENAKAFEWEDISASDSPPRQSSHGQDLMRGSESKETSETLPINVESNKESQDEIVASPAKSDEDVGGVGLGSENIEVHNAERQPPEGVYACSAEYTVVQNDLVSGSEDQEVCVLSDLSREGESGNKDQEENMLSGLPQKVVDRSLGGVSHIEDLTKHYGSMLENMNQEESLVMEQPQLVGEELLVDKSTGKEIPVSELDSGASKLTPLDKDQPHEDRGFTLPSEQPHENAGFAPPCEEQLLKDAMFTPSYEEQRHEDAGSTVKVERNEEELDFVTNSPIEVTSDDSNELIEAEASRNFNKDDVDQPSGSSEVGNEDIVVIEPENHEPLEISYNETLSGQEAVSVISPRNIEEPVAEEETTKVLESIGEREVSAVQVEEAVEVPPSKENKDKNIKESRESSNVACSSRSTISLADPHVQENEDEIIKEIPEISNAKLLVDRASGQSLECQKSAVAGEKIIEEYQKLREMLEKLLASGKEQQEAISNLNGKVKGLERKLAKRKKVKSKSVKHARVKSLPSFMGKID
ncbi:hypothetical protein BVRB_1g003780 [Beta vulgaris subsp. vulgaris]|uniref:BAG family molecular chaperone regulator 6 n=1 Tax=Beta vulgaris subsp. vulgaris TaxID=3555 RepID=UPI0005401E31|nr:BAG family molecular chaperone regulator 6 [Beta vulgaris subsp. vulgaris]KMT20379.1 hypothetical protein BVRB_1g003780 [Beta vulgaris subsp. vulgaris]